MAPDETDPVVEIPITDTLDLHTFSPREVGPLIEDYLSQCHEAGIREVRIIHGKGKGVQRRRVQALLSRSSLVEAYHDADSGGGGWGATIASLKGPKTSVN
jgi:DNA-nicking Smr family endonuclease